MMANAKALEIDGLSEEFDPIWYLTAEQLELQKKLVELCKTTLRPNAIKFDANLEYPRYWRSGPTTKTQ